MRAAFISFALLSFSLGAFQGNLQIGGLLPESNAPMLQSQSIAGNLTQGFFTTSFDLEQRRFQSIFRESRLTLLPSFQYQTFKFGIGAHYRSQSIQSVQYESSMWTAIVKAEQQGERYFIKGFYSSSRFYEVEAGILSKFFIPIETSLKYREDQGFFDGLDYAVYAYWHRVVGSGLGYSTRGENLFLAGWIRPAQSLTFKAKLNLPGQSREFTSLEFSLQYRFGTQSEKAYYVPAQRAAFIKEKIKYHRKIYPPSFQVLVRHGLSVSEALRITKEKDLCSASKSDLQKLPQYTQGCES